MKLWGQLWTTLHSFCTQNFILLKFSFDTCVFMARLHDMPCRIHPCLSYLDFREENCLSHDTSGKTWNFMYKTYGEYCVCKYHDQWIVPSCFPSPFHRSHDYRIPPSHSFKPWSLVKLSHRQPTFHSPDTHVLPTIPPSGHLISSHRPFPLTKCWLCTLCKIVVCMYLSFG